MGLPSLIKTLTEEESNREDPTFCEMCMHCFHLNARQPTRCTTCNHPHRVGWILGDTNNASLMKSTKCVRRMGNLCDGTVKEIDINPIRFDRWHLSHLSRESKAHLIAHEVKAMREFHVKLACVLHKTDYCPLLDVIMTRFNHQPKMRDLPQAHCTLPISCGMCAP